MATTRGALERIARDIDTRRGAPSSLILSGKVRKWEKKWIASGHMDTFKWVPVDKESDPALKKAADMNRKDDRGFDENFPVTRRRTRNTLERSKVSSLFGSLDAEKKATEPEKKSDSKTEEGSADKSSPAANEDMEDGKRKREDAAEEDGSQEKRIKTSEEDTAKEDPAVPET
eukprot:GILK01007637.1.p2 GENE.GILK01007637.1~~GILK01007637.1.p2  ORF type:complete len:193 (+),score=39.23 GILK01007637.1:62-580(+)